MSTSIPDPLVPSSTAPAPTTAPTSTRSPWPIIGAVAAALSVVAIVVAVVLVIRTIHEVRQELREAHDQDVAALTAIKDDVHATTAPATWIGLRNTHHVCIADNSATTCVVTNPTEAPISTCFRGNLTQKKARGVHLTSMVACTRLGPHETKSVVALWAGGFARDVCSSANKFGGESLDWETCDFMEEPVELDALAKLAPQAPPAAVPAAAPAAPQK